jgi:hypothetical protein
MAKLVQKLGDICSQHAKRLIFMGKDGENLFSIFPQHYNYFFTFVLQELQD